MKQYGFWAAMVGLLVGCSGDIAPGDEDPNDPNNRPNTQIPEDLETLAVSGEVVDFVTGLPVDAGATVTVSGVEPAPTVTVTGAQFEIDGIPPFSIVQLLAGAPPAYRSTYNAPLEVAETSITDVGAMVVSNAFVAELEDVFGFAASDGGIVLAQLTDAAGAAVEGISRNDFGISLASMAYFLDANMQPDAAATATSVSGWVVFHGVPAGLATVDAALGSGITITSPQLQVASTAVSIVTAAVTDGEQALPVGVSFAQDVAPIFTKRGCDNCHSGNNIGADLGNLALNGSENKIFKEITNEVSPTHLSIRIDVANPAGSLLLTMPGGEDPPDSHPTTTFTGPQDVDYLMLLAWITEGAKQN
jgi:hypothetical protein